MLSMMLWSLAAHGGECPSVEVTPQKTQHDLARAWIHEPGWFLALDKPPSERLARAGYAPDDPMLVLREGEDTRAWPVAAMAYHHVANDRVGKRPVVVTY